MKHVWPTESCSSIDRVICMLQKWIPVWALHYREYRPPQKWYGQIILQSRVQLCAVNGSLTAYLTAALQNAAPADGGLSAGAQAAARKAICCSRYLRDFYQILPYRIAILQTMGCGDEHLLKCYKSVQDFGEFRGTNKYRHDAKQVSREPAAG